MVDRDSTLMYSKSSSDFIIYSELFDLGSVKLNMANKLTDTILKDPNLKSLEDSTINKIGLNVIIKNKKNNSGSILFEYKDLDQLNKIIEIIKSNY